MVLKFLEAKWRNYLVKSKIKVNCQKFGLYAIIRIKDHCQKASYMFLFLWWKVKVDQFQHHLVPKWNKPYPKLIAKTLNKKNILKIN